MVILEGIMKHIPFIILLSTLCLAGVSAQPLTVTSNARFLMTRDGKPFFWLGDTAWELFHRLNREEAAVYLEDRASRGFNVIQAVALYEQQAFESPNAYGDFPLSGKDITRPDTTAGRDPANSEEYDYWDHVEYIISEAAGQGMLTGLLPCWGEYVTPRFRDRVIGNVELGYGFGWFMGNRFRHLNDHIVWILGGDRLPDEWAGGVEIWRAMAEGITDAVNGENGYDGESGYESTFMTYHCYTSSARWFHEDPWLDMNTWGSYHEKRDNERAYYEAMDDWNLADPKPTLNSEPAYERVPVNYDWKEAAGGRFDDFDVRQQAYWSVFAGTCGHTYGCNPIWQMYKAEHPNPPLTLKNTIQWFEALDQPGAIQMGYLKALILSRDFHSRRPDQAILAGNLHDPTGHLQACSGDDFWMVYIPTGKQVEVHLDRLDGKEVRCSWFSPRDGTSLDLGMYPTGSITSFDPPGEVQRGNDWVLVIDFLHQLNYASAFPAALLRGLASTNTINN